MKLWKICKYDIREGIGKRMMYLWLPVLLTLVFCISQNNKAMGYIQAGDFQQPTIMDFWICLIEGKKPYRFDLYTLYQVPVIWVTYYTLLLVSVNAYPVNDLTVWGYQVIVRSKSRLQWWIGKCCWCALSVMLYFGISFAVIAIYALGNNIAFDLHPTADMMAEFAKMSFMKISMTRLLLITIVQPILLAVLLGMLQMVLSFLLEPMISFCIVFAVLVGSTYITSWLLPGNWGMPYRMDRISKNGLDCNVSIIALVVGIVACVILGYYIFKKEDINL